MRKLAALSIAFSLALGAADAQRLIVTDSGGVEREVKRLIVTDGGGIAREIQRLFVIDSGGTARLVYQGATVNVDGHTISDAGSGFLAAVYFNADGTVDQENTAGGRTQIDAATDWIIPNSAAADATYHVRATEDVGSVDAGSSATDTWLNLDTDRVWVNTSGGNCTLTIEISDDGGSTVIASGTYSLELI